MALIDNIAFCVAPRSGQTADAISGQVGTLIGSAAWQSDGLDVPGTTSDGASWPLSSEMQAITTAYTILVRVRIDTLTNGSTLLTVPYYPTVSDEAPFLCISYHRDGTGSAVRFQYTGAGEDRRSVSGSNGHIATSASFAIYAVRRDGTAVRWFKNGTQNGSDDTFSANLAVDWQDDVPVIVGNGHHAAPTAGLDGLFSHAVIWARALTDQEVADASSDAALDDLYSALSSGGAAGSLPPIPPAWRSMPLLVR